MPCSIILWLVSGGGGCGLVALGGGGGCGLVALGGGSACKCLLGQRLPLRGLQDFVLGKERNKQKEKENERDKERKRHE